MKKRKLKLTNENVRFLDKRTQSKIRGGNVAKKCTDYCVQGENGYATGGFDKT